MAGEQPEDTSALARLNSSIDRLPAPIVVLAFLAACSSALALGFGAVSAVESPAEGTVELRTGFMYDGEAFAAAGSQLVAEREGENPACDGVLPFPLEVPSGHETIIKCTIVVNNSAASIDGRLVDTDVGDGPLAFSLATGETMTTEAVIANSADLDSLSTLTWTRTDGEEGRLEAASRTYRVEGASITGESQSGATIHLSGAARNGHRLTLVAPVESGRFEFEDLPPSDAAGYRLLVDDEALLHGSRPQFVGPGDRLATVRSVVLDPTASVSAAEAVQSTTAAAVGQAAIDRPDVLAFDAATVSPLADSRPLFAILTLSAAVVICAMAVRGIRPVGH